MSTTPRDYSVHFVGLGGTGANIIEAFLKHPQIFSFLDRMGIRVSCLALDVADPEPIDEDDPLLDLDNLIILPHIASASVATRTKMAMMAAENLLAGLRGDILPNCVNAKEL